MRWLQARLALLLPMGTALILLPTWWRFGRDPALGSVPVAYEPPEGLPPAVLGALVQENVGGATLRASLVDLSVKGHLRIEQLQEMLLFLPLKRHYRFTLLTSGPQWQALAPHEVYLLEHLFPSLEAGRSVDTEELRDHFYVHIPGFEELVRERVLDEGFYRRWPGTVRGITFAAGLAAAAAVVAAALGMLPKDIAQLQGAADPLITVLALLATLALIGAFAWSMPSRTPRGVEVLRRTLGFQAFLRRVDAPRYRRVILTPELFERFLPYAIVAGLTARWALAFQGIVQAPPDWYVGGGESFNIEDFGTSLTDCCSVTGSAMQSSVIAKQFQQLQRQLRGAAVPAAATGAAGAGASESESGAAAAGPGGSD